MELLSDARTGRAGLVEEVAEGVTLDALAFHEVAFDQRPRGFDRILRGPSGQIIVLESKCTDKSVAGYV